MSRNTRFDRASSKSARRPSLRKLAFEHLEDRRVLSGVQGPEPVKLWLSNDVGDCWTVAYDTASTLKQVECPEVSLMEETFSYRTMFAQRLSINVSRAAFSTGEALTNSFVALDGRGAIDHIARVAADSIVLQGSTVHDVLEYSIADSADSLIQGPVLGPTQDPFTPSPPISQPPTIPLASPLSGPPPIYGPDPPQGGLFAESRVNTPLNWTVSPDATVASQRKFLVGSGDSLLSSTSSSRFAGPSDSTTGLTHLLRMSDSPSNRRTKLSAGRIDRKPDLDLLAVTDSSQQDPEESDAKPVLGKSSKTWSRLASALIRNSKEAEQQATENTNSASTSPEMVEMARDVIFAQMASQEVEAAHVAREPSSEAEGE